VVINGIQDEHPAVGGLASHAPLMKKIHRVTFNIGTIQGLDAHNGDLGMCLLVNLPADLIHLRDRVLIQNVREVIDVVGGFELSDRFGSRSQNQRQCNGHIETQLCPRLHRKENCTGPISLIALALPFASFSVCST
jgi:hypothetical protein